MKKIIFVLCFCLTVVVSCENNDAKNSDTGSNDDINPYGYPYPVDPDTGKPDPNYTPPSTPPLGPFAYFPFVRETFDRERQLWLAQDIQNYSFSQCGSYSQYAHMPEDIDLIIQNGKVVYFRRHKFGWEIARPDDGFPDYLNHLKVPITSLYSQIDELVNTGNRLAIEYKSDFHYPRHVDRSVKNGYYNYSWVDNFTIDPEIPAEVIEWGEKGIGKLIPNPLL